MFDAGAIQAHLDVDLSRFNRNLDAAEERVRRFERDRHEVKISAVFDTASMGRARQMFAQLDQSLSRDAMQRLRSSPQGSVLGALNAMFSPHPVSGAPSAQQAASGGLLGRMVRVTGGMMPGAAGGGLGSVLVGQAGGQAGGGRIVIQDPNAGTNRTAAQSAARAATASMAASIAAGKAAAQTQQAAQATANAAKDTSDTSRSMLGMLRGVFGIGGARGGGAAGGAAADTSRGLADLLGRIGISRGGAATQAAAISTAGRVDQSALAKIIGAAGPGIGALSARSAGIIGLGGLGLGAAPALIGGLAPLIPGAAAVGGAGLLFKGAMSGIAPATQAAQALQQAQATGNTAAAATAQKQLAAAQSQMTAPQKQLFSATQGIQNWWQTMTKNLTAPIAKIASTINQALQGGLGKELTAFFTQAAKTVQPLIDGLMQVAKTALPLLTQSMAIATPLLKPLIVGLGSLVTNIFPGLNSLLKAAAPAVKVVAQVLGQLGTDIGSFFADLGPSLKESGILLQAVFGVVGDLLPIIAQLAGVFAKALAPVIGALVTAFKALSPSIVIVGKILGELAGAILTDLAGALVGVAKLIGGLAPSFAILASVMGQVFNAMENAGVFAALANVIEQLAPLLANLINALVKGLAPILPILITLLVQVSTIMVDLLGAGIAVILQGLTWLIEHAGWLVKALGVLGAAWIAMNAIMAVSPMGWIIIGIVALIGAIALLATHWHRVWTDIKNWAMDAWNFLTHGWGQFIILPLTEIRLAVAFTRDHWKQAWTDIKNWTVDAWHAIWNEVVAPMERLLLQDIPHWWDSAYQAVVNHFTEPFKHAIQGAWNWVVSNVWNPMDGFITKTVPGWWDSAVSNISAMWQGVEDVVKKPVVFVIDDVLDGLIRVFDDITNAVGLGKHIGEVHPFGLARGGRLPGWGGGDILPALLEPGETVVSKEASMLPHMLRAFREAGVPGYQHGGKTGQAGPGGGFNPFGFVKRIAGDVVHGIATVAGKAIDIGKLTVAFATGNQTAFANAFGELLGLGTGGAKAGTILSDILIGLPKMVAKDLVSWIMGQASAATGSGADIANYAMTFLGKIPYVWGGTSLTGADCSGFTGAIYKHFGINAPRTSEAQYGWAKKSPPVAGGLAFYISPAGGPPPGHVAIVRSANQVISQGGGMGPTLMAINAMPLMGTGVPPGGFGAGGGGGAAGGSMSAQQIAGMWTALGGPGWAAANMARIAFAESGDNAGVIQQGQPPGLTGYGLYQITPTSGIVQNGAFGNLLNAANNTRAAISLFSASGYGPWASDPVGRQLSAAPFGYAKGGIIREPVIGFGTITGSQYRIAENAPEAVVPLGKTASGALIGNVFIQLPEGQTVARALTDVNYWLSVARQQNYAGVMPGG